MKLKFSTVSWEKEGVKILDQTLLPNKVKYEILKTPEEMAFAIKTLKIRGAPLIGICAAYGVALASYKANNIKDIRVGTQHAVFLLEKTRPTAYNLFSSLNRIKKIVGTGGSTSGSRDLSLMQGTDVASLQDLKALVLEEAHKIKEEEEEICQKIGEYGAELIPEKNAKCITHCNAGALATSGIGTALAPIYIAREQGKAPEVFARETRPILQGARLTAWELSQADIPVTLLCDSACGYLMTQTHIDLCIVGADRIAKNGDTANKIGTYTLAVLAKKHKIPFYVAAPSTTFDLSISSGEEIPIEFRGADEVRKIGNIQVAPKNVNVFNPAFDVTPAGYITAFITENGIQNPPFDWNNGILR